MTRLVRAELLKLVTTRLLLWNGLLLLALEVLVITLNITQDSTLALASPSRQREIASIAAVSALVSLILGIVSSAGEYGHGTIAHTLLVAPVRPRVAAAKLTASALAGAALALAAGAFAWGYAALLLSARSVPVHLGSGETLRVLPATVLAAAITGAIGVGFGLLVRRQTGAIVIAFVWLLVVEPLLALAGIQEYAPGHTIASVVEAGTQSADLLGFGAGLLLALGYAAAFAVAGAVALARTDVS